MEDQDFRISPKFYKKILYYTLSDGTRPIKYPFPIENKEDLLCEIEKVTIWNCRRSPLGEEKTKKIVNLMVFFDKNEYDYEVKKELSFIPNKYIRAKNFAEITKYNYVYILLEELAKIIDKDSFTLDD